MAVKQLPIAGLKRRAKQIKRGQGIMHAKALDLAAEEAGFQNFAHARRLILTAEQSGLKISINHHWRNYETKKGGVASISISLSTPIGEILRPHHFVGYLGGDWIDGAGNLCIGAEQYAQDSELYALERTKRVARALEFMQITGLRPSGARRCYPKSDWQNRPPIADHDHCWYDANSGIHIFSTEPYPGGAEAFAVEMRSWEARFGYVARQIAWGSIYGFGTEFWLIGSCAAEAVIDQAAKRLLARPTQYAFSES